MEAGLTVKSKRKCKNPENQGFLHFGVGYLALVNSRCGCQRVSGFDRLYSHLKEGGKPADGHE